MGGVIYSDSADKAARFVMDCNQTNLPIIFFQDVTGFMVGRDAEESGIIRSGAKLVNAVSNSLVPKITVVVGGGPTGIVYNGGRGFVVRGGGVSAPARFIYACEDGMIRGWSPTVPRVRQRWSSQTEIVVDPGATGTVFRGITLAAGRLYATDFHNARVRVSPK